MAVLPRTLLVIALRAEAAGVFEAAGESVLYCGVGKVNAAIALTRELTRYALQGCDLPLVVNFGSAGSRMIAAGTLVGCHEFVQRDMDVRGLGFALGVTPYDVAPPRLAFDPVFTHLPAAICGSGDSFATAGSRYGVRGGRYGSLCLGESLLVRKSALRLREVCHRRRRSRRSG